MITKHINEQWELEVLLDELSLGVKDDYFVVLNIPADGGKFTISSPIDITGDYVVDIVGNQGVVPIIFNNIGSLNFKVKSVHLRSINLIPTITNKITITADKCGSVHLDGVTVNPTVKGIQPLLVRDCNMVNVKNSEFNFIENDTSARAIVSARSDRLYISDCTFTRGGNAILVEDSGTTSINFSRINEVYLPVVISSSHVGIITFNNSTMISSVNNLPVIRTSSDLIVDFNNGEYGTTSSKGCIVENTGVEGVTSIDINVNNSTMYGKIFRDGEDEDIQSEVSINALYSILNYTADSSVYMFEYDNINVDIANSRINTGRFMNITGDCISLMDNIITLTNDNDPRLMNYVNSNMINFSNNHFKLYNPSHFRNTGDHGIYVNNYFELNGNPPKDLLLSVTGEGNSFANNITSENKVIGGETE